jgi:hypothetical protein
VLLIFVALFRDDSNESPIGETGDDAQRGFTPITRADGEAAETGAPR